MLFRRHLLSILAALSAIFAGCGGKDAGKAQEGPLRVRFQTDWFPQAEHGGFYYAYAMGYYAEEGLDVEIMPGGLTYMGALKITESKADFAMHKAEAIMRHADRGMPLRIVMATLQHDPQGIMLHAESPIKSFRYLDGAPLMAMPGGTFLAYLKQKFDAEPVIIPSDKGMERFLSDPTLAQQCMLTSEPFYAKQHGVDTRVLLLRDGGLDAYHVIYTSADFAKEHPEAVNAFVRASIRGWKDYLTKDPTPAFDTIKQLNPRQSDELLNYARDTLRDGGFAYGDNIDDYGKISDARMSGLAKQLLDLGIIQHMPDAEELWGLAPKDN